VLTLPVATARKDERTRSHDPPCLEYGDFFSCSCTFSCKFEWIPIKFLHNFCEIPGSKHALILLPIQLNDDVAVFKKMMTWQI
jgi:hypothetical protein